MISIFLVEVTVCLVLSQAYASNGYITFPAATAALRKIPGFETGTFAVPADVNSLTDQLSKTEALIETDISNLLQQASIIAKSVPAIQSPEITKILTAINGIADQVGAKVGTYENGVYIGYVLVAFLGLSFLNWVGKIGKGERSNVPSEPYGSSGRYSATLAAEFFSSRPIEVFNRGAEIAGVASVYALGLLSDLALGKLTDPKQEEKRADQLTDVLTRLGSLIYSRQRHHSFVHSEILLILTVILQCFLHLFYDFFAKFYHCCPSFTPVFLCSPNGQVLRSLKWDNLFQSEQIFYVLLISKD